MKNINIKFSLLIRWTVIKPVSLVAYRERERKKRLEFLVVHYRGIFHWVQSEYPHVIFNTL